MYAIFFDYKNTTYRLPTNPEEINVSYSQANQKYEVLRLGQIVVPTHLELVQYSFECELPLEVQSYVFNKKYFLTAQEYIKVFKDCQKEMQPIRFIAGSGTPGGTNENINTLVLIEEFSVTEKAGEEGDKYVSFKLLEYREFGRASANILYEIKGKKTNQQKQDTNPKSTGIHVVISGDNLWNIAKKYYGDGSKYTKIYNANKDKIKNPALIYPGQKLVIP